MQAVNYAQRFTKWGVDAFLFSYEMAAPDTSRFRCKRFESYDEEWLDYVSACRLGLPVEPFDIIEGGIADDKVYISNVDAMDMFYNSRTFQLISQGIADFHCRSDRCLAEEVERENESL
jgi:hypothetical protein